MVSPVESPKIFDAIEDSVDEEEHDLIEDALAIRDPECFAEPVPEVKPQEEQIFELKQTGDTIDFDAYPAPDRIAEAMLFRAEKHWHPQKFEDPVCGLNNYSPAEEDRKMPVFNL